jgi:hypothetical protein
VPGDVTVECDAVPSAAGPTATDNCDKDVSITFKEDRKDGPCIDSYTLTRTWIAVDNCGNAATGKQVITVQDTTPPVLSGVPGDVTVECDAVPPPTGPTAIDNCDPAPRVEFNEMRTDGRCKDEYTLTRTWTAFDRCGNSTAASQLIHVVDTTPPAVSGLFEQVSADEDEDADEKDDENIDISGLYRISYSGTDNCDTDVEIHGFVDVYGSDETCDDETPDFNGYPVLNGDLVQFNCSRTIDCSRGADEEPDGATDEGSDIAFTITGPAIRLLVTGEDNCGNKGGKEVILKCPNPEGCIHEMTLRNSKGEEKTFSWYEFKGDDTTFEVGGESGKFHTSCSKCIHVGDTSGTLTITCIHAGKKLAKKCKVPEDFFSTPCP